MNRNLNPRLFMDEVVDLYEHARKEIITLLKAQGDRCYIVRRSVPLVGATVYCPEPYPIIIWGVGLDADNELCIRAYVDEERSKGLPDDFPEGWIKVNAYNIDIDAEMYPRLYYFVVKHLDKCKTREEADMYEKAYSFLYEGYPDYLTSRWGYRSDTSDDPDDEDEPLDLIESNYLFDKEVDCAEVLADSMYWAKQVKNEEQFIILSALLSSAYQVGRDDTRWQIEHDGKILFSGTPQDALANYAIVRN